MKILLFNPRSANSKPRIPNSVLQIAASVNEKHEFVIVDGNCEKDPLSVIMNHLKTNTISLIGTTVMPGPQLSQAITLAKKVRETYPEILQVWGGYFPSSQPMSVLQSGWIDFIVKGPGDSTFPKLLEAIENNSEKNDIPSLVFLRDNKLVFTAKADLPDMDALPELPYSRLNAFYPLKKYLGKSYLGEKTLAYHSSFGCPFTCSFCAVVPIYQARWKGKSAQNIFKDILYLKNNYGADSIEFHDNNFFVSEKRTVEFAKLISPEKMAWWGEARIDTMDKYKDESLQAIADAGCKMIFFGAESGDDETLKKMDKGGTQTGAQIKKFAARIKKFGIVPELSFVLGTPAESPQIADAAIDREIKFIREVKELNPQAEIIIYIYSPVPTEGSELFSTVKKTGFQFPVKLEDWLKPEWLNFDLRRNPLTPWLKPSMIRKIRNFEVVLNAYYPTVSDIRLKKSQKSLLKLLSTLRYKQNFYALPLGLKVLQKLLRYRQPEIEGF